MTPQPVENWLTSELLFAAVRDPEFDPIYILAAGLDSSRPAIRADALRLLRDLPSSRAITALAPRLRTGSDTERAQAAEVLGLWRNPAAVPLLLDATHDANAGVRMNAAEALGNIGQGDYEVQEALCGLLERDIAVPVRVFAAEALGNIPVFSRVASVVSLLHEATQREIPAVRVWAWYALARYGETFAEKEVFSILRTGGEYHKLRMMARCQAAKVLCLLSTPRTAPRISTALRVARKAESLPQAVSECLTECLREVDNILSEESE